MTEAQPYLALRAQTAGRIETDRLELGRVNLRHALAERDIDAAFDRCVDLRRRWRADRADDQILRRILDDAGRLALRIAFDHAARYVGGVAVDPRELQRPGVEEQHMEVIDRKSKRLNSSH